MDNREGKEKAISKQMSSEHIVKDNGKCRLDAPPRTTQG